MQEIFVSKDKSKLDVELIHRYLSTESYWAQGRSMDDVIKSIRHSVCFAAFRNDQQIGFARVVTDHVSIAHVADVFVLSEFQGNGVAKKIMSTITTDPDLQGIKRWMLGTRDAHELYRSYGFKEPAHPERWMEKLL